MLKRADDFKINLDRHITRQTSSLGQMDYFTVLEINKTNRTIHIKKLNSAISYSNVPIMSIGSVQMPKLNSIVVCAFLMNSQTPICLGSVPDLLSQEKDIEITQLDAGETASSTKGANSTLIKQKADGTVIIANSNGSFQLNADGTITINDAYTLPNVDGSVGQVLTTNGSGSVYWN